MSVFKVLSLLKEAKTYLEPDEVALKESGVDRDRCLLWHRRVVGISLSFGALAGLAILAVLIIAPYVSTHQPTEPSKIFYLYFLCPPIFFLAGCVYGATFSCLIAPRDFLLGPLGRKWMGFVGTANIYVAKVVCVIVLAGMTFCTLSLTYGMLYGPWQPSNEKRQAK